MSAKTRLSRLEKSNVGDKLWVLIGIGRPNNAQDRLSRERLALESYLSSNGNRGAYIAYLPFDSFPLGFLGYIAKSGLIEQVCNKSKNPAES